MATASMIEAPPASGAAGAASSWQPRLTTWLGFLAGLIGLGLYAFLTGLFLYNPTQSRLISLFLGNLAIVAALGALIAIQLVRLWRERRSGRAGAKLHVRLVALLGLIAVVPLVFVAMVAAVT